MNSEAFYHRARIQGTLTTLSALHIGSGELEHKDDTVTYNAICRAEQPYMPAATLRGFLADVGTQVNSGLQRRLFGYAEAEAGQAGALRVYDAPLAKVGTLPPKHLPQKTALRAYVALNPITGVAEAHHLFNLEYVPSGSVFHVELELTDIEATILAYVLELLTYWDGSARSSLGSGASKGRGRVQWHLEKVEVLDGAQLERWLTGDFPLAQAYKLVGELPQYSASPSRSGYALHFRLYPQGPFLLNDPAYVQTAEDPGVADLEYSRTPEQQALIPATALRGWLRGRARRILLTLLVDKGLAWDKANAKVDEFLSPLFGSTEQQSLLWFDDAVSANSAQPHFQMFNAVDRFTGGVAEGKLYQVCAAECDYLSGVVYLPQQLPAEWCKGLLLLLMRDALEGDLVLGWGKGRGYGSFRIELQLENVKMKAWEALTAYLRKHYHDEPQEWLKALHQYVTHSLQQAIVE